MSRCLQTLDWYCTYITVHLFELTHTQTHTKHFSLHKHAPGTEILQPRPFNRENGKDMTRQMNFLLGREVTLMGTTCTAKLSMHECHTITITHFNHGTCHSANQNHNVTQKSLIAHSTAIVLYLRLYTELKTQSSNLKY